MMMIDKNEQIILTGEFVRNNMKGYDSGHDWWHIERVRKLAQFINETESLADPFIVDITALLHDTADSKFAGGNNELGYAMIGEFMDNCRMSDIKDHVLSVIRNISFSNKYKSDIANYPLLWVIQDADRLDAIGAIGIARAFNYGGFRNNSIYVPGDESGNQGKSTIGHFYDKLLKLRDLMNTATGRKIADDRHQILENFLLQFYSEWNLPVYSK
jgi:uncharacterized protein